MLTLVTLEMFVKIKGKGDQVLSIVVASQPPQDLLQCNMILAPIQGGQRDAQEKGRPLQMHGWQFNKGIYLQGLFWTAERQVNFCSHLPNLIYIYHLDSLNITILSQT